ncbi:COQ9 family protein [Kordiimonas sp. SCSIO 12610]|uniref:COQ9 family protein n=1 Tax=Kordiimonas sp. SCSIO 12610 TaxID=2829597 RepID=UPI00210906BB|nr:COQ9 family protein [Kordiimonas sp. SCSIO 12610]UTW55025.1 COQ9 family protein [Kordiimonas sp. SCSIO 12610]
MALKKLSISDMTPEELRVPLMEAMMDHIAFDGWSVAALNNAASDLGISSEMAELAFPRGAIEVLELHLECADTRLMQTLTDMNLPSMRIRDRITVAVKTRLEQNTEYREAIARALALLAMPQHVALGPKALWRTADTMWRAAGDTSTDHNWYTKRMTLSGVYSAVLLYWLNDESDQFEDTWEFLDRRIEDVMKIEKTKFEMRKATANMPSLSRFLGRLRFPSI